MVGIYKQDRKSKNDFLVSEVSCISTDNTVISHLLYISLLWCISTGIFMLQVLQEMALLALPVLVPDNVDIPL